MRDIFLKLFYITYLSVFLLFIIGLIYPNFIPNEINGIKLIDILGAIFAVLTSIPIYNGILKHIRNNDNNMRDKIQEALKYADLVTNSAKKLPEHYIYAARNASENISNRVNSSYNALRWLKNNKSRLSKQASSKAIHNSKHQAIKFAQFVELYLDSVCDCLETTDVKIVEECMTRNPILTTGYNPEHYEIAIDYIREIAHNTLSHDAMSELDLCLMSILNEIQATKVSIP